MQKMTLEQAKAVAISKIAEKLGLHIDHKVDMSAAQHMQEKSSVRARDELHAKLDKLIDEMVSDSLTEHLHSQYQPQIDALRKELREQKETHESELKEILDKVEAYQ